MKIYVGYDRNHKEVIRSEFKVLVAAHIDVVLVEVIDTEEK